MNLSSLTTRRLGIEILTASFVVLFQELALIRWLPSQIRVIAYFPNVVLISAFLGLGLGALRAGRRSLLWLWPVALAVLIGAAASLSGIAFTHERENEFLWLLYFDLPPGSPVIRGIRLPIIGMFILSAISFIPLGQFVADRLNEFQRREGSLWGYSWDLLGSLLGVIAFSMVSFGRTFPVVWFAIFLTVGAVLFVAHRRLYLLFVPAAALMIGIVVSAEKGSLYSPYYSLNVVNEGEGFAVLTNRALHQRAVPLAEPRPSDQIGVGYHLPYRLLKRAPGKVLVVGAGTGNDVAVALRRGATAVDAVEIDPVILSLGERHPNRPYSSPRVHLVNNDARAYLNRTPERYDLIVFGTLDSMTQLSALSNVRLDNFVYTRECLQAARNRLTPDGGIVLYFMVGIDYIDHRLRAILGEVFGEAPIVVNRYYGMFNRIYLAGPAFAHLKGNQPVVSEEELRDFRSGVEAPSDDWPYLYLARRAISPLYLSLIVVFAALAVVGIFAVSPEMRSALRAGAGGFDGEMFLFGLAFLMIETKLATQMNLVWGATWLTSAVVFGSILLMVLIGTVLMQVRPLPWSISAIGLTVSLVLTYFISTGRLATLGAASRLGLSILFVGLPVLFASVCFALLFKARSSPGVAFGWNLLGAVCGGLLEFSSMAIGFRSLTLLALTAYLLAFLLRERHKAIAI